MSIPKYSGTYAVGCFDVLTKAKKIPKDVSPESLCNKESDLGLLSRIYYPCTPDLEGSKSYRLTTWFPEYQKNSYVKGLLSVGGIGWLTYLVKLITRNLVQHCLWEAPLIDHSEWQILQPREFLKKNQSLPLVIFSHGLLGTRVMYSAFCTQLASEGFIVACVEHRDGSSSYTYFLDDKGNVVDVPYFHCDTKDDEDEEKIALRNMQVNRRQVEVSRLLDFMEALNTNQESVQNLLQSKFDLNCFKGRIDTSQPLIMGHSFGGATAVNALNKDDRFKCGVGLDVWFQPLGEEVYKREEEFKKPLFMIFTEYFNWKKNLKRTETYIDSNPKDYVEMITLKRTGHMDQCDIPGIIPWFLKKLADMKHTNKMEFYNAVILQRKVVMDYFGKYLQTKDFPVQLLSNQYELPSEFIIGSNLTLEKEEINEEVAQS